MVFFSHIGICYGTVTDTVSVPAGPVTVSVMIDPDVNPEMMAGPGPTMLTPVQAKLVIAPVDVL
jgi:hypothetical protein